MQKTQIPRAEVLDDLRNTLTHARHCHEGWRTFQFEHPERRQIVEVFNTYPGFFSTVSPALFTTFAVELCSLFGTRSDEITLKLIPDIEVDPEFTNIWKRGRRFYKYRNKFIAHRDTKQVLTGFENPEGISYNDIHRLLDDTCGLFDIAAKRLGIPGIPQLHCDPDLLLLIQNLHRQYSEFPLNC